MLRILRTKQSIKKRISLLQKAISNRQVMRPKNVAKFIFLCGANKDHNNISERRSALIDFSITHLKHTKFFIAERIFSLLQDLGHKGNILDIEHRISEFADLIILILESPSAFAELGAFSHKELREKLIVINNEAFENSGSFINLGPIKAIEEAKGKEHILYYKMREDGVHVKDAIGDIFSPLYELLKEPSSGKASPINSDSCNPSISFNKDSVMFVHDLIYLTGPISHKELIEVLSQVFGKGDFKLQEHVAILNAFEAVTRSDDELYRSRIGSPYLEYKFDLNKIISVFRNICLKYTPERI